MPEPDDTIKTLLQDLSTCLCNEITVPPATEPPTCLCIPIPGIFPADVYGGAGDMAWVRLVDMFPSNTPGVQFEGTYDQSFSSSIIVEMGITRCYKVPNKGVLGERLLLSMWEQQMSDVGAMERAIVCCTGRTWDASQLRVGNYRPRGPEGELYGGVKVLALQLD